MRKLEPTCWRFKSETRYNAEVEAAGTEGKAVRRTVDVRCQVIPYYAGLNVPRTGQRRVKTRFGSGREYHIPARDLVAVLEALDFEVTDLRVR